MKYVVFVFESEEELLDLIVVKALKVEDESQLFSGLIGNFISSRRNSTALYCIQYCTLQHCTVFSTAHHCTVFSTAQHCTVFSTAQHCTVFSTATALYCTV